MTNSYQNTVCDNQGLCYGTPPSCPDFIIKQHDTRPAFKVNITDCDLPVDLTDLIIEASMWTNTKLKINIESNTATITFADNIGFEQINYDTIIQIGNGRLFERMLIKEIHDFDNTITVIRGQLNTGAYKWKKGTQIKLLRFLNNPAIGEMNYQDIEQIDGTALKNQLVASTLVYEWLTGDTCMCGKYFLEFKALSVGPTRDNSINFGSNTNLVNYHCDNGADIQWVRRYPNDREGFLIQVNGSPTAE
jgi:hypothetical protein